MQNIFESYGTTFLSPFLNKAPLPVQKEYPELLVSQYVSIQAYPIQQYEAFRMNRKKYSIYLYTFLCMYNLQEQPHIYIFNMCVCVYTHPIYIKLSW